MAEQWGNLKEEISTHALTWRATVSLMIGFIADFHFYPRPHMEGDGIANAYNPVFRISTHALTWRATNLVAIARQ